MSEVTESWCSAAGTRAPRVRQDPLRTRARTVRVADVPRATRSRTSSTAPPERHGTHADGVQQGCGARRDVRGHQRPAPHDRLQEHLRAADAVVAPLRDRGAGPATRGGGWRLASRRRSAAGARRPAACRPACRPAWRPPRAARGEAAAWGAAARSFSAGGRPRSTSRASMASVSTGWSRSAVSHASVSSSARQGATSSKTSSTHSRASAQLARGRRARPRQRTVGPGTYGTTSRRHAPASRRVTAISSTSGAFTVGMSVTRTIVGMSWRAAIRSACPPASSVEGGRGLPLETLAAVRRAVDESLHRAQVGRVHLEHEVAQAEVREILGVLREERPVDDESGHDVGVVIVQQRERTQHRLGAGQRIAGPLDLERQRAAQRRARAGRVAQDVRHADGRARSRRRAGRAGTRTDAVPPPA